MYKFEQDFHRLRRQKGELKVEEINALWIKRQKEMFGNSVVITPNYAWRWSYIPHFIHTPFYVYAYAFGELLTLSLYAQYKRGDKTFVDKYLKLLTAGGSKSPQELLNPLRLNLKSRAFWRGGINLIRTLVKEAKEIYENTRHRN
jgi:oligoendopeptidase F